MRPQPRWICREEVTTLLPVHRLWILGLGLVGRYGLRKASERVRIPRIERTVVSSPRRRGSISDDGRIMLRERRENVFDGLTGSIRVLDRTAQSGETLGGVLVREPRPIDEISKLVITVNLVAATITVPSSFGVLQTFYIDLDRIDPSGARDSEAFTVTYTVVILAAMKACLRSTMLRDCFDASTLLRDMNSWHNIVYIQ